MAPILADEIAARRSSGAGELTSRASRIRDAQLAFFDGGHLFLLQDRAAWPAVIDFLAR